MLCVLLKLFIKQTSVGIREYRRQEEKFALRR